MTTRTFVGPEHNDQHVNQFLVERSLCADNVAKVVLLKVTKIRRAVGAVFV
jgi:hypothetical protein